MNNEKEEEIVYPKLQRLNEFQTSHTYIFRICLLGDSSVGKTSLITRYANGIFKEEYLATIGLDYYTKEEMINNQNVLIQLWDTAGQERFKALTPNYFKNAEGVILVYDVTNSESFENLKYWIGSIKSNLGENNLLPIIIIGNKIDMDDMRDINKEDAEKFSKENDYKYFEASAKTGEGVDDAIRQLVNLVLNQRNNDEPKEERNSVQISGNKGNNQKKKGCC